MAPITEISDRLRYVQEKIISAACRVGRNPDNIRLIAVSKGQPVSAITEAFEAGQRDFGENYVEEALPKIGALGAGAVWHMIGHVQSRKAKTVVEGFSSVHSVDSLALARRLSRFAAEQGRTIPIFLECNVSGEGSKFGWKAEDPSAWNALVAEWKEILLLPAVSVHGLMTMAPYGADPEQARPFFRKLRVLRDQACRELGIAEDWALSMGMSDDFEQAVEEDATFLRIGRMIFGDRSQA
jgi:pyridoxal phosphate enzyme (YggS family)